MKGQSKKAPTKVEDYQHSKQRRKNNPPIGLAKADKPDKKRYYPEIDPHDSPFIMFKDREKTDEIEVPTVPLHVHESIQPSVILDPILSKEQTLDDFFEATRPHNEAVEFYEHEDGWTNRMIAGDSLLVMNSLLEKENMTGRVQMIYFDPPYGIKYNSNFQQHVFSTKVKDHVDEVEIRPEPIKAFRDTWTKGIHSYLAMIRKRLELARRLLSDTGSIFVQISTTNQHLVRMLLDEMFGPKNFMWQILFRTKGGGGVGERPNVYDYILWYAKDKEAATQSGRVHQLWEDRTYEDIKIDFVSVQLKDGTIKTHGGKEIPHGSKYCKILPLYSKGKSTKDRSKPHTFPNGETRTTPDGSQWSISHDGLDEIYKKKRLYFTDKSVSWVFYPDDAPKIMTNLWEGMQINQKKYVVETKDKVLERCIQLCSDVGDLVMDITTGSGVTAYTAEKLGRRWITCDASRVSLATTRWRLQTCAYPWYKLVDDHEGVDSGFEYESFLRLSAKTLSDIAKLEPTVRYNKPKIVQGRSRVTGPFTMESIPSPTVSSKATKITIRSEWIPMLENSGIMTKTGRLRFDRVERNEDVMSPIHAFGVIDNKKTAISFGPEYGPMGRYQVESVLADLSGDVDALFMAMAFDPVAKSIISKTKTAQAVQINNDVLIQDLKSQSSDQPFSMVGEPDIKIDRDGDRYVVRLLGYDYYSTDEDRMIVGDADDVAIWMLDTDYDGRTLRVKQLFFPNRPDLWDNLKRTLRSEVDSKLLEKYSGTESIAFEKGNHKRVAVKIIDKNGNESLKVVGLEEW